MKNLIVVGCGRSGTSAITGAIHNSGYNTGDNFIPLREGNPKGFFEDSQILKINEKILFNSYPKKYPFSGEWILDFNKNSTGNLWLSRLGLNSRLFFSKEIEQDIKKKIETEPFCYKDPRFCYTLELWKPYLKKTSFICIFREPAVTASSLIKEYMNTELSSENNFPIDFFIAVDIWKHMYQHVLEKNFPYKDWLFVHYNQLFSEEGLERIDKFLGIKIDRSFIEEKLKRTKCSRIVSEDIEEIYKKLCKLAEYEI